LSSTSGRNIGNFPSDLSRHGPERGRPPAHFDSPSDHGYAVTRQLLATQRDANHYGEELLEAAEARARTLIDKAPAAVKSEIVQFPTDKAA